MFVFAKTKQELLFVMKSTNRLASQVKDPLKPKQQTYRPFREINSKIIKSGMILGYAFNFTIVLPGNETVNWIFLVLFCNIQCKCY